MQLKLFPFYWLGIPIKSTLDNPTTIQYTGLISGLTDKARGVVRDLDPTNDLTFLRVRSKKHEIMIAPGKKLIYIDEFLRIFLIADKEYMLIVVQNTHE